MILLGGRGSAPRKDSGNDHQPVRPDFLGMGGMGNRLPRVLGTRPHNRGHARFHQPADALLALVVGQ